MELETLGPGRHFGALALLTGRPRTTSVQAVGPVVLTRIPRTAWTSFVEEDPAAAIRIMEGLLDDIRDDLTGMTDSLGALLQGRSLPRSREVTVQVGGESRRVPTGTRVGSLLPAEADGAPVVAGLLGQDPVSLATPIFSPASVAPLTAAHWEGRQIYARSLGLVLLEAAQRVAPGAVIRMGPSRGRHQEVEVPAGADRPDLARRLAAEMRRMVAEDLPVHEELWTRAEAVALFRERGWDDAALLLRTRREQNVPLVTLGQVYALSPGPLLSTTGRIRAFGLEPGNGGLLLDLGAVDPRSDGEMGGELHEGEMIEEHARWLGSMGVESVGAFN
jgi:uridine kinase